MSGITYEQLHELTRPFARYEARPAEEAWAILCNGAIEETLEFAFGFKTGQLTDSAYDRAGATVLSPEELAEKEGEIGDILYYISEMSRYAGVSATDVIGDAPDLASFQQQESYDTLPIIGPKGESLTLEMDDRAVLAVAVLRAVDILRPKTLELWRGIERPTFGQAIGHVTRATAHVATRFSINIEDAVCHTVDKLASRERPPAVIAQAAVEQLQSGRDRLEVIPWVRSLMADSAVMLWNPDAPAI